MSTISEIILEFLHGYTMTLRNSLTSLVYEPILRATIEIVHEIHFFLNCEKNKIDNLMQEQPEIILTANIGCHQHLQRVSPVPVRHWIEEVADLIEI